MSAGPPAVPPELTPEPGPEPSAEPAPEPSAEPAPEPAPEPTADLPPPGALEAALKASWPAAATRACGPFTLRDGLGGGRRVSAATAQGPADGMALEAALEAMAAAGQRPLFRLRPGLCPWDDDLDKALAERGFVRADVTLMLAAPVAVLAPEPLPRMRVFALWPPLAVQRALWAEGGVGPERVAVMARAGGPRTALMARQDDRVAGTAFVALQGDVGMVHAMEVTPALRRRGAAGNLVRAAADWAGAQGARWLGLAVTEANGPARTLYARLGMVEVGRYHYRVAP
ncbi:MAG: GNAT family N-acetyltransferase [Alkalilacustris sp.]